MLFGIFRVFFSVELIVASEQFQGLVQIHILLFGIHNATCNVGAMVRNSFHIGNEIAPYKACFNTALAHTQAVDMTGAEKLFHSVNDLLKGFYKISLFSVTLYKCTIGK